MDQHPPISQHSTTDVGRVVLTGRPDASPPGTAQQVVEASLAWYTARTREARRGHRVSEVALLVAGALVPATVAFGGSAWLTAALGVAVVVLTGLRRIFTWQENWVRFTAATVRLQTARQLHALGIAPYAGPDADARLVLEVRAVETGETASWAELVAPALDA